MTNPVSLRSQIKAIFLQYEQLPTIDLSPKNFDAEHGLIRSFLYYLMAAWIVSGFVDWWWHKQTTSNTHRV